MVMSPAPGLRSPGRIDVPFLDNLFWQFLYSSMIFPVIAMFSATLLESTKLYNR